MFTKRPNPRVLINKGSDDHDYTHHVEKPVRGQGADEPGSDWIQEEEHENTDSPMGLATNVSDNSERWPESLLQFTCGTFRSKVSLDMRKLILQWGDLDLNLELIPGDLLVIVARHKIQ